MLGIPITFPSKLVFYSGVLSATRPTTKIGDHRYSAVRDS